jgi:hypothetical protein
MYHRLLGSAILLSLLSTLLLGQAVEGAERRETLVRQIAGRVTVPPGSEMEIRVGLTALPSQSMPYRTALAGLITMERRAGGQWVGAGTAHASGCYGDRDPYALAKFTFAVPASMLPGSRIELRFSYAGNAACLPCTGTGCVLVQ